MAKTCFAHNQLGMMCLLTAETIAREARIAAKKAAREAYRIEMAEARIEAVRIARAAQARRKPRTCLTCGGTFPSEHAGHRRCVICDQSSALSSLPEVAVHANF